MTLQAIAGIISGLFAIVTVVPYLWSTVYGTTRPSIISQSLWGLFAVLAVVGQYSEQGFTWSMATAIVTSFNNILIVAVCLLGYGYTKHTRFDIASGILALVGVVLWQLTSSPMYAVLFAVFASVCAGIPTYHKTFLYPETENTLAWSLVFFSSLFSLLALTNIGLLALAYPLFAFLEAILVIILTRRKPL